MAETIDTAEVARIIRSQLKAAFRGTTKFAVRSKRYAGGSSIRVEWTDGPTKAQVEAIVGNFYGSTFDGMIDLKSYHVSKYEGKDVRFGNDFLFFERNVSLSLFQEAREIVVGRFPDVTDFDVDARSENPYFTGYQTIGTLTTHDVSRMVNEEIAAISR